MTTADEDRIAARRAEAIRLRVRGKTIREIAEATGVSVGQAHTDVRAAMRETARVAEEDVQAQRGLDLGRLERALDVVEAVLQNDAALADGGELHLKALDRLVKIQEQRAKLLGLYAPEKRELSGSLGVGEPSPATAAELVRKKFGGHAAKADSGETPPAPPPVPGSTSGT